MAYDFAAAGHEDAPTEQSVTVELNPEISAFLDFWRSNLPSTRDAWNTINAFFDTRACWSPDLVKQLLLSKDFVNEYELAYERDVPPRSSKTASFYLPSTTHMILLHTKNDLLSYDEVLGGDFLNVPSRIIHIAAAREQSCHLYNLSDALIINSASHQTIDIHAENSVIVNLGRPGILSISSDLLSSNIVYVEGTPGTDVTYRSGNMLTITEKTFSHIPTECWWENNLVTPVLRKKHRRYITQLLRDCENPHALTRYYGPTPSEKIHRTLWNMYSAASQDRPPVERTP